MTSRDAGSSESLRKNLPPILRLPDEILELIFKFVKPSNEGSSSYFETSFTELSPQSIPTDIDTDIRAVDTRSLLLVCRRFFRLIQPTIRNVISFPVKISAEEAHEKSNQIKYFKHKNWVKGFRMGNPCWNRPFLEISCLSSLFLNFSNNLVRLSLEGTAVDNFLSPDFYQTLNKLNSLSLLELGSKFHVLDLNRVASTLERCPNLRTLFLTVRNLFPLAIQKNLLTSKSNSTIPPIFSLSIKFWDNSPARISVLPEFLSAYVGTLKLIRLDGHLGPGLSEALRPVANTLAGLGLTNIVFGVDRLFDLEMPQLTTLELGAQFGLLPYVRWDLFSQLSCLVLHVSPHIHSSSITALVNIPCLSHLVLMNSSNRQSQTRSDESKAFFLWQCMARCRSVSDQKNPLLHCDVDIILKITEKEGGDLKKWCDQNQISLSVVPRVLNLDQPISQPGDYSVSLPGLGLK